MAEPTRPGEIPHSVSLTDRAGHAVAELAYSAALAERALYGQWVCATEALSAGASHCRVADAMGLDVEELCAGLRSWARNQLRQGLIDTDRHAQVCALAGGSVTRTGLVVRIEDLVDGIAEGDWITVVGTLHPPTAQEPTPDLVPDEIIRPGQGGAS
jgi:hypothetical protein